MISRAFPVAEVMGMIFGGRIKDAAKVAALGLLRFKDLV
jgi:ADP-ribose pyrophosphatase